MNTKTHYLMVVFFISSVSVLQTDRQHVYKPNKLSHIHPKIGRLAKFCFALFVYQIYQNLLTKDKDA